MAHTMARSGKKKFRDAAGGIFLSVCLRPQSEASRFVLELVASIVRARGYWDDMLGVCVLCFSLGFSALFYGCSGGIGFRR